MVKKINKTVLSCSLILTLFIGCGGYDNEDKNIVGEAKLLAPPELLFDFNSSVMQGLIAQIGITDKAAFGIKGYKIIYATKNDRGEDVNASGLITVPVPSSIILEGLKKEGKNFTMSIVSDQHGTIFPDSEAPTTVASSIGTNPAVILSPNSWTIQSIIPLSIVGGFVTIQPDYIGFGSSKGITHPYLLEKSSANTVIDMIESTLKFGNDGNLPLNGQIYLTGYSEGGYATLAAAKEIEKNYPDLSLKGVAPMSGPYDLNLTGMGVLGAPVMQRPDFIGGIVNSYSEYYDLDLTTMVKEPYATKLPTFYKGDYTGAQIRAELTESIDEFFVTDFKVDFLTNPNNRLRTLFVQNNVNDYKPTTPTRLYYCKGDSVIPSIIPESSAAKMGVEAINLSDNLEHVECATPAYQSVAQWFNEIRSK